MGREQKPVEAPLVESFSAEFNTDPNYDKPQDECGIVGIYAPAEPVGRILYNAMQRLQHRGQSGAGVAYPARDAGLIVHSGRGLIDRAIPEVVPDAGTENMIDLVAPVVAIGHTRYSTADSEDAFQPFVGHRATPTFAVAHNGHIESAEAVAERYDVDPSLAASDSGLVADILDKAASMSGSLDAAIAEVTPQLEGAYNLIITDGERIIGVRDPWGTHPFSLAELASRRGYVLASETVAFQGLDVERTRDVQPGEIVAIGRMGLHTATINRPEPIRHCMFEYGYISRPDSIIDGVDVYTARKNMGKYLAIDRPVEADAVVAVPNSGLSAAGGYARESGIPQVLGLFKDEYVGRSFIERGDKREAILRRKLNPNPAELSGRRVVLVDDSLIKGNTLRSLVGLVREAGATEVHVRLAMPRYEYPCFGGMDTRETWRLIARDKTDVEIAEHIGADSVGFNSVERIDQAVEEAHIADQRAKRVGSIMCTGCATGEYPYKVPADLEVLEPATAVH